MNDDYLQDPFTVFKTYCAIKTHFNSNSYDYVKFGGKIRTSEKAYRERKDRSFFIYLAKVLSESDNEPFFVSQFVDKTDTWIGDILFEKNSAMKIYNSWVNRIDMLEQNYIFDINNLNHQGYTWESLFKIEQPDHPKLFKLVMEKRINPETYVLIDKMTGFINKSINILKNDSLYYELNLKYKKYSSFIKYSPQKVFSLTPKIN